MRCRTLAAALAAALLLPAAAAEAKAPPKGVYDCTIGGILFDSVKITGKTTYKRFGKKGTYVAKGTVTRSGGLQANKIRFRTGPFKGFKGNWYKVDSGAVEIALENPEDGFESIYCGKR